MNTTIFQYALEVERTRSITQAAENLLIAQPNLSKAIRETEEALGYTIFHRTPRGAFPTEKGVRFLDAARAIVQQLKRMEQIAGDGDGRVQRLSLSMPRGQLPVQGAGAVRRLARPVPAHRAQHHRDRLHGHHRQRARRRVRPRHRALPPRA